MVSSVFCAAQHNIGLEYWHLRVYENLLDNKTAVLLRKVVFDMPSKQLLIMLAGDAPEPMRQRHGNYDAMFMAMADCSRFNVRVMRVFDGEEPEAPQNYCGVLVTGAPAMVTDNASWMVKTGDWLRDAIRAQIPVLGVCFGHQLIAQALGGVVDRHPLGTELGTHEIMLYPEVEAHPWLAGLPATFSANLAHSQTVREVYGVGTEILWGVEDAEDGAGDGAADLDGLGQGADSCCNCKGCIRPRILACSGHDPHQIVAYGDKCLTVQFHPEFNGEIIKSCAELYEGKTGLKLGQPMADTPHAASILQRFLDSID